MKLDLQDVLFFLLRHGETAGNKKNVYRSWSNAPEAQLDPAGKKGAKEAGDFLVSIKAPIQLIISDTLDRVVETCELVALSFPEARLEMVRALHPLNMGDYTLKSKERFPVEPFLHDHDKRIPGGETVREFNLRQKLIFNTILKLVDDLPPGSLLVGGHGSTVAYLHNHEFNDGEARVGYEGLVDPGGIIAVTRSRGLVPLLKVREKRPDKTSVKHPKPTYPDDHVPAGKVPKGGSCCEKCPFLGEDRLTCINKFFIAWNGSDVIPGKIDEYCSDWFPPKESKDGTDQGGDQTSEYGGDRGGGSSGEQGGAGDRVDA